MRKADLHLERLDVVTRQVVETGARSVLDLGCGEGELLGRLAAIPQFERLLGIDVSSEALGCARMLLGLELGQTTVGRRVVLRQASFTRPDDTLKGFDTGVLLETIEHVEPKQLSAVERTVFGCFRPGAVIVTTPNCEYNVNYGLRPGVFRHPDHRFEWTRAKFRAWAAGVAGRNAYTVEHHEIGDHDALRGGPTQMAIFRSDR